MRKGQVSLRLDEVMLDAVEGIAASQGHDRADVLRTAVHEYVHRHAPAGWNERYFAMSQFQPMRQGALEMLTQLRVAWTEQLRQPDGLETAKMLQWLGAVLVEVWLIARELEPSVIAHSEPGSAPAETLGEVIAAVDAMSRPLFNAARLLDLADQDKHSAD
ncbi:hypothetical protein [Amycolatopsis sp. NPDC059657]|uniref:hypothetical protein n=1 Tax=Amycolatopsis sp. NPDC059657 TaxID=3346899 RepID=UPI003670072F